MQLQPIRSWKVGIPFVVLCVILGLAVGFVVDKATAYAECDNCSTTRGET